MLRLRGFARAAVAALVCSVWAIAGVGCGDRSSSGGPDGVDVVAVDTAAPADAQPDAVHDAAPDATRDADSGGDGGLADGGPADAADDAGRDALPADVPADVASDAAVDVPPADVGRWTGHWLPEDEAVHVLRDDWGVPHVFARDAWGAGYGAGQAQAADRLEHLLRNLWTVQGRRGEADGPGVLNIDRTMRLLRLVGQVEDAWPTYDDTVRAVFEGFAAGVNDWMAAHPEQVPAWAEPIQASWSAAFANLLFVDGQMDECNGDRGGLAPPLAVLAFDGWVEFRNPELPPGLLPGTKADPRGWTDEPAQKRSWLETDGARGLVGSNAWAVAPERSADGNAIFLGDPHMPWNGAWALWEVHLRSADFEVAGATFVGLPVPIFARNENVVWSFTSNGVDNGDAYRLTLDPADPERYLLDGASVPFEVRDETLHAAGAEDVTLRLRWSALGPVTWHDPVQGYAVAYRYVGLGQPGAAVQFLGMVSARDVDDFEAAMSHLQITRFHVLAADTAGQILYVWNGRVPRRPAGFDYDNVLDGTTTAAVWDPDDVVPWAALPRLRDPATGWIQNCNNAPWNTTETAADPRRADFPSYGFPGDDDSERAWRLRRELAADDSLTHDEALGIAMQGDMIAAEPLLPLLRTAWTTWGPEHPDAARLSEVMGVLGGWEGDTPVTSAAPTIFLIFLYELFQTTFPPVDAYDWTEADLDEELGRRMLDALSEGVDLLVGEIGMWRIPWGVLHAINIGQRRFQVACGQYPGVSLFNCNVDPLGDPELTCRVGSAYTFLNRVERPIRTWSVLPLGQSPEGRAPYRYEMTKLYAERKLKPLAFADDELWPLTLVETVHTPARPE
jgi:acyl-homoserine lactone acylase PvdQ